MSILNYSLHDLAFLAFDLETTGLNVAQDRIVEIGACRFTGDDKLAEQRYTQVVNPHQVMSPEVIQVHHISQQVVDAAPDFDVAYEGFLKLAENTVLVAHHAAFDISFLKAEAARLGAELPALFVIDTFPLAKACFPEAPSFALGRLMAHLGLVMEGDAHRALPDAMACQALFKACLRQAEAQDLTLADFYERFPRTRLDTQVEAEQSELWNCLQQALNQQTTISICYTNSRKKQQQREITPLFLGGHGLYTYVDAFCHLRQAHRRFYFSRITECKKKLSND